MKKVVFIMGVSGSGKTAVGQMLAKEWLVPFIDGDDHHPLSNIEKMSQGIPLVDSDRVPWLDSLHQIAIDHIGSGCVIACSALKEKYRKRLSRSIESDILWVYLRGSYDLILERINKRAGHFMKAELLRSQFETLEEPKYAIDVNISDTPEIIVQKIKSQVNRKTEFGVLGLGVMGKSLSRNLARNGFKISMYNRHVAGQEEHIAVNFKHQYPELKQALPFDDLKKFIQSIQSPRKILLMINAASVDVVLDSLKEVLEAGDIVIDGGNSHFTATSDRMVSMKEKGLFFIGAGISGGAEGALKGPSIMPSGDEAAYLKVQKYLEAIAAKDREGKPCCTYVGTQGSGHFVKMIHNGIEYVEMQLLAECYFILKNQRLSNEEIASVFEEWMNELGSYLLEITINILRKKEGETYLLDKILDKAANKGTGKWTTHLIAEAGAPTTMIPAALFARYISFFKEKRQVAANVFSTTGTEDNISVLELKKAYQFSRIINHHQGFSLIARIADRYHWSIDRSEIARIWTAGCIIKSDFMKELIGYLKKEDSILLNKKLSATLKSTHTSAQSVAIKCIRKELHIPCLLEAMNFFHGIKTAHSSANLIQAQRDYFGAHTYQKIDDPTENSYHTAW